MGASIDAQNRVTNFVYDWITGVQTARILPDRSTEYRAVDAVGQVIARTDFNGQTTSYTYDGRGRVLSRSYPDGRIVSFTYTPTGHRATATDARGTTSYAYDPRNRVVQLTYPDGRMLTMGYDAHGNRTALTAKIGVQSWTTKTGYDADHRPNRITDPLERSFAIAYDADGNRTQLQYPNTTTTSYAYDARNRTTGIATVQGTSTTPILSYAYTLDLAGRRTQLTEGDGTVRAYGYDGIDRLTTETVTGALSYAKTFAYDAVGNRLTQTTTGAGAGTVHYAYDARDRLTTENATSSTSYTYDADGNVTAKAGEAAYTWDFENRLTSATMSSGTVVAHTYDPDGNRVQTSVTPSGGTATTTNMLVDTVGCASCRRGSGLPQVIAETDGSGNLSAYYVRAGDELLAVMRPAGGGAWNTRIVHHDGLGSVRALTDETGTTIDTRGYEAFGTKTTEAGNDPLTYGFAGEPFQTDSMLAYHRARWMDARVGKFEGMDRVDGTPQEPLSLHRYIYAGDSPTGAVDPSGNEYDMVSIGAAITGFGIMATTAGCNPDTRQFDLTAAGGNIRANLRSREVQGTGGSHLYIEYVDKAKSVRDVREAKPDFRSAPGGKRGYLYGLAARPWGVAAVDPGAPGVAPAAYEKETDSTSPLLGVSTDTRQCLERARLWYNTQHIVYQPFGPNSNSWALQVLRDCSLTYPAGLPDGYLPGTSDALWTWDQLP